MNTEELTTFIYLSKVKNFTLAAKQLFIAQSTVTNRISELEKEVGKKLFYRGSKNISLTEEGEIFLKYAERILELQKSSISEMNAASAYHKQFSIGAINVTYESYVKPIIDECLKDNDAAVKIFLGHSMDIIQLLQDNTLDVVFSAAPLKRVGYECKIFDSDKVVLVRGKGFKDYPDGICREQLKDTPYLMCYFSMSEIGVFIRSLFPEHYAFKLEVDNSSKLLPYLKSGNGYSFLPYKMVKEGLEKGELEEVKLKDFSAPDFITYIIYKQGFDPSDFLNYGKK